MAANSGLRRIEYLIFKQLGKTDLDVLGNASENEGHTYITLPRDSRQYFDELTNRESEWTPDKGSDVGSEVLKFKLAAVKPFPSQDLTVRVQGGARGGEIKMTEQRTHGVAAWVTPIRKKRPGEYKAYIFLLRDESGELHGRYVDDLSRVPEALRLRIKGRTSGALELAKEGGMVLDDPLVGRVLEALRLDHNVILYGPPGTGKTWIMLQVRRAFEEGIIPVLFDPNDLVRPFKEAVNRAFLEDRSDKRTEFLVFHQSTAYENFVVGIRPEIGDKAELRYTHKVGPFLRLADHAAKPKGASLLLIDEINRGNAAEIFGEVITVLEIDKRLTREGKATPTTVQATLPYDPGNNMVIKDGRFSMPYYYYVLASMNSVDRSVAPLDSALRRRFRIIEVPPDLGGLQRRELLIGDTITESERPNWSELAQLSIRVLKRINDVIAIFRGPDFQLGHAYLWDMFAENITLGERRSRLFAAFSDKILPQLREMFRDQPEELRMVLGGEHNDEQLYVWERGDDLLGMSDSLGWLRFLPFPGDADIPASLVILRNIAPENVPSKGVGNGGDEEGVPASV